MEVVLRRCRHKGRILPYSFVLTQNCSNNMEQYQVFLIGLGMVVEMQIPQLEVFGNFALVIKQLTREFKVEKIELIPCWRHACKLLAQIPDASLHHNLRAGNGQADALAGIVVSLTRFNDMSSHVSVCERWVIPPSQEEEAKEKEEALPIAVYESEIRDWREPIINFLQHNSKEEGHQVLKETHGGIYDVHQAGPKLHMQVKRLGYCWTSMLQDAIELARTCKACQLHGDYTHQPPKPQHPIVSSWPFKAWGMDIIDLITLKSNSIWQCILAATDFFSK
ncbi:hypothetical protein H6P81_006042 [Aristolochia fimbriata]|uniref:RNase H type-1 domain-containing protein n=1 Tax=Aristolochia fimbriata TaxID=158543 RepID=A0AAV7F0T5_ARIFI|nr:hypothetical protein H6P81_006042 [Aristolochia fimbriata]